MSKNNTHNEILENLYKKSGDELRSDLDIIMNTFSPSDKIHREFYLDNLASALGNEDFDSEYKMKLVDFIKTGCEPHDRLIAHLTIMATEPDEIMKVRWHIFDALEQISPKTYEELKSRPELVNREADPEKPALDINEARKLRAQREAKNFKYWAMSPILIFAAAAAIYISWGKTYFIYLVIAISAIILLLIIKLLLSVKRCPSCKRYFARGKLIKRYSFKSIPTLSSPGRSSIMTTYTMRLYSTSCKYCKHEWIVIRG